MAADCKSATQCVTEVRILPCAPHMIESPLDRAQGRTAMDGPGSRQRMFLALLLLSGAAIGVWRTMEPGRYRDLAWVLIAFFAFRVLIGRVRQRHTGMQKG